MCGIAGFHGLKERGLIDRMLNAMSHRGPDYLGKACIDNDNIFLAHARLSILDLSPGSNQPLWNKGRTHCIVFNGEIYNYRELRDDLIGKGYDFNSSGDAEVLLNLFIELGAESLNLLNGMFAFAIWSVDKKELFVARDQLGIKPLYYSQPASGFIFASELKSLLQDKDISREVNQAAISHYLRYLWCPSPMTPLKEVEKLEPGHYLIIKNGRVADKKNYYRLPNEKIENISYEKSKAILLGALEQSVGRQLVADVKIGAFLSGGLDSSSIVAIAAKKIGAVNIPCFTIDFDGGSSEGMHADLPYAKKVAKHLGVNLHVVKVDATIAEDLPKLVYQLDEPQADMAPLNAWYIAKLAKDIGIKVLLSGAGGDDLLTGYRRHYALEKEKHWRWMPRYIRELMQLVAVKMPHNSVLGRRISKAFRYAGLSSSERLLTYFQWLGKDEVNELFLEDLGVIKDPIVDYVDSLSSDTSELQKMLHVETRFFLCDHNLNYTDKVSMAEGVEVRVPLVDLDMVNAASRIPDRFKQKAGVGKWIFKKAMEKYLPAEVIYRPKTGFGAPVRHWIQNELNGLVENILSEKCLAQRSIFDPVKVRNLIELNRVGKVDAAYTILALICIELWFRQFLDPEVPTPLASTHTNETSFTKLQV